MPYRKYGISVCDGLEKIEPKTGKGLFGIKNNQPTRTEF
jgi:hypothetical protein